MTRRAIFGSMLTPLAVGLLPALACAQGPPSIRKVGGFRCVDLRPFRNDSTYDLYEVGYFSYAGFSMDIWKRNGVPFWYARETGCIRVAGPEWRPVATDVLSSPRLEAVAAADNQQPGNGAIASANDADMATYWYAGEGRPHGKLWITWPQAARVKCIRLLGWATPRHAPKDYSVGLILPDETWREIERVDDETRMGEWIEFRIQPAMARGVYVDVRSTAEAQHGPVIYELQARGEPQPPADGSAYGPEVVIPLSDTPAEELFCLGQVGGGFRSDCDRPKTVGEYVVAYADGKSETVPLVAGRNVAEEHYGSFVPEATFAFGFRDRAAEETGDPASLNYHLDELQPVDPKLQLLLGRHRLGRPGQPIRSLTFRCTDPASSLVLAGLTLRQSGPRPNALVYGGKRILPYPKDTPRAKPSPLQRMADRRRTISLDGRWRYQTDPGNLGARKGYFAPEYDMSGWPAMPVPSQWYVHGLDYHGVVWFRRTFEVPASFPGQVLELCFGAVDYDARVWVNGQYVGRHVGAFSSFRLDVTNAIRKGARNTIAVRVDSPIDPGIRARKTLIKGNSMDDICMPYNQEGCMGGIYRPVQLVGRGEVGLADVWTASSVSRDLQTATVSVRAEVDPAPGAEGEVEVYARLTEPRAGRSRPRVFEARQSVTLGGRTPVEMALTIPEPKLWYPWDQGTPHLHVLELEARRGDEQLDRHVSRVGVREITFDAAKSCVHVNHHRTFLKGMLNDDVHWMSLMDRTGYHHRVELQRRANLNLVRMVGHQSSPDMYDLCDELGMMIWQEMPLQWQYSSDPPVRDDILRVVTETVTQCRGHASVIGWSAWNEGGQGEFSDQLVSLMQELDPTRPLTKACGGGGFDVHIYPNLGSNLSRHTPLWVGIRLGFVSEVGAYGLSSLDEMRGILGGELFPFDTASYYWETFNSYRYNDGPVFTDGPAAADWPTERVREWMLDRIEPSERWLSQFMKFMFENFRAQRFDPTTAAIHCRFDDPLPTAFLGIVNFNGRPRRAYDSVQEACQPVVPILFLNYTGVEDIRVVNDYWFRSWEDCLLEYVLRSRDGEVFLQGQRRFDLPPDAAVSVVPGEEIGDIFARPGFLVDLRVRDRIGTVLSENHYDLTNAEVRAFVETVYPVPPTAPYEAQLIRAEDLTECEGTARRSASEGTYSNTLLEIGDAPGEAGAAFAVEITEPGEYLVRVSTSAGQPLRAGRLLIDGQPAELESYPYIDMNAGITRLPYSTHDLSWRPGWRVSLSAGHHRAKFCWPPTENQNPWLLDAVAVQRRR